MQFDYHPRLIQLVCDYGTNDPAFAEVIQRMFSLDPTVQFHAWSVPVFSTLATGFWIAQLALYNPADQVAIFSNTAPRHDDHGPRANNQGESFVLAILDNGVPVGAVNSGYCLSLIKPRIKQLFQVQTPSAGSQFRSRDFFAKAFYQTIVGQIAPAAELSLEIIPPIPQNRIMYVDGYGNIKTTLTAKDVAGLEFGQKIQVTINQVTQPVIYSPGIFGVPSGEIALSAGSSGDPDNPFLEIFLRRGAFSQPSAYEVFNSPWLESTIELEY